MSDMTEKETKIAFIGTGVMGAAMAANLQKGGYPLAVYNRTKAKAQPLLEGGAVWKETPGEAAAWADVVITMVGYPKDVEEVYFGAGGILERAKQGALLVDMTTSSPSLAVRIHDAAARRGLRALDAPVSGGDVGAKNGTLSIMAGGDEADFEALRPVFAHMGGNIVRQGGAGAGQQTKMCNQICIAANLMGVCESLEYAVAAGLDPDRVIGTLSAGGANSWQLGAYAPRILKGDYAPGFYVKHLAKDLRIALAEAGAMKLATPALALAQKLFDRMETESLGEYGTQVLYRFYREHAGEAL